MEYIPPLNGDEQDPDRPYVDADPAQGIEGSRPPAGAIEYPQREIIAAILAAGLEPSNGSLEQLAAAIIILGGQGDMQEGRIRGRAMGAGAGMQSTRLATLFSVGWIGGQTHRKALQRSASVILEAASNLVTAIRLGMGPSSARKIQMVTLSLYFAARSRIPAMPIARAGSARQSSRGIWLAGSSSGTCQM